jgi:hypothetical protein
VVTVLELGGRRRSRQFYQGVPVKAGVSFAGMIRIRRLRWDQRSIDHIARHGVSAWQVHEVCRGPYLRSDTYGGRFMLLGRASNRRILCVIRTPEGDDTYYTVTPALPMSQSAAGSRQRWETADES